MIIRYEDSNLTLTIIPYCTLKVKNKPLISLDMLYIFIFPRLSDNCMCSFFHLFAQMRILMRGTHYTLQCIAISLKSLLIPIFPFPLFIFSLAIYLLKKLDNFFAFLILLISLSISLLQYLICFSFSSNFL